MCWTRSIKLFSVTGYHWNIHTSVNKFLGTDLVRGLQKENANMSVTRWTKSQNVSNCWWRARLAAVITTGWRKQECALSPLIRDLITEVYNANRGDLFKRTVKYGETLRANSTLHRVLLLFQNDPMFYGVAVLYVKQARLCHTMLTYVLQNLTLTPRKNLRSSVVKCHWRISWNN